MTRGAPAASPAPGDPAGSEVVGEGEDEKSPILAVPINDNEWDRDPIDHAAAAAVGGQARREGSYGGPRWNRTNDLGIKSPLLYQLS